MWRNFKRLVLYLYNRPRVDFATYTLVTQHSLHTGISLCGSLMILTRARLLPLMASKSQSKRLGSILYKREIRGKYDTDILCWTCSCGQQKYHSYLLCKHLVQAVPRPKPDWWAKIVQYHVPPFYDICKLLSSEERARAPEPEELGNRSWLARMHGTQVDPNTPTVSTSPVCLVHV